MSQNEQREDGCEIHAIRPLKFLRFDDITEKGIKVDDDLHVGARKAFPGIMVGTYFWSQIGRLEGDSIANIPAYAYIANTYERGRMDDEQISSYLNIFSIRTTLILLALWLVKDNSVNGMRAYLRLDQKGGPRFVWQDQSTWFSRADCQYETTEFSIEEWFAALSFYNQFDSVIPQQPENQKILSGLLDKSRVARALWSVQATRNTSDLAQKIASYCTCFETFFSTTPTEVTHGVSERTAVFLGTTGAERRGIYRDIKALYKIRSTAVHGGHVKIKDAPGMTALTQRGDDYLRRCLTTVLRSPTLLDLFAKAKNPTVDEYFVDQLFPLSWKRARP